MRDGDPDGCLIIEQGIGADGQVDHRDRVTNVLTAIVARTVAMWLRSSGSGASDAGCRDEREAVSGGLGLHLAHCPVMAPLVVVVGARQG